jgi:hypothetical protein
MKIINRLYQYLDYKQIKPTRLEKELSISNGYFGTQLKRSADLGESMIIKIIDYCLDLNSEWLLTGTGEMIKSTNQTIEVPETIYVSKSQREKDLELTIQVQQELIDSLKNRLRQYEEGVQDVGVAGVG